MKKISSYSAQLTSGTKPNPFNVQKVVFSQQAYDKIRMTVGNRHAESGGALFGYPNDLRSPFPFISDFVFDIGASTTHVTYSIDTKFLNPVIHDLWEKHGLEFFGIVHSHPVGCRYPSNPDMAYFHRMHTYMERPFLITPIIFTQPDGGFKLFCYLVGPNTPAIEVDYCIMNEEDYKKATTELLKEGSESLETSDEQQQDDAADDPKIAEESSLEKAGETVGIDYDRQKDAVDNDRLHKSKIVITGTGGFYEGAGMFARSGIGELVFIDPDMVDATNLCRQGYLPRQVGMLKVEALCEHIKEINPEIKVSGYPVKLQDLTPEQENEIFSNASLAIFTTDSFYAQAHGNKIALRYNIPAIWGGFYERSLASEIVFYIPGVTPGCYRCAVSPRYKAQEDYKAQNGKEYSVSSSCNTIFHSALLDAQIGMLAMAIIHNNTEGKTFSGWFGDKFDQNLIQMNVNPLYHSKLFDRVFANAGDSAFLFDSVWQHIEPEVPPKYLLCPDCHGGEYKEIAI